MSSENFCLDIRFPLLTRPRYSHSCVQHLDTSVLGRDSLLCAGYRSALWTLSSQSSKASDHCGHGGFRAISDSSGSRVHGHVSRLTGQRARIIRWLPGIIRNSRGYGRAVDWNSRSPRSCPCAESDKLAARITAYSGSRARNESRRCFEPDEVWILACISWNPATMVTSWLVPSGPYPCWYLQAEQPRS